MPYRIKSSESLGRGVVRAAREQVEKAIDDTGSTKLSDDQKVHQIRKRCKKLRGLIRLVRSELGDAYDTENAALRDLARQLAGTRDAAVMIQTYDKVMDHYDDQVDRPKFASIRRELTLRYKRLLQEQADLAGRLSAAGDELGAIDRRIEDWPIDDAGFEAAADGLKKTYARARDAMARAYEGEQADAFHDWRKRVKYHRFHCRLLAGAWRRELDARQKLAGELGDVLGDEHDLHVLRGALEAEPEAFGRGHDAEAMIALLDQRSTELREQARPMGHRLFAEKPKRFVKRIKAYWHA